jgi:hypothetical protein
MQPGYICQPGPVMRDKKENQKTREFISLNGRNLDGKGFWQSGRR